MSWAVQEIKELQVEDKVRTVNGAEASVVVVDSEEAVIKFHHDGSYHVINESTNIYIYERDGKPYPVTKEIDCIREHFAKFECYEVFERTHIIGESPIWVYNRDCKHEIDSAPRYKGFAGYVYKVVEEGNYLVLNISSASNMHGGAMYTTRQPLAVLFDK